MPSILNPLNLRLALIPHPDTPCAALSGVFAEVARTELGDFVLRYTAEGDIGGLRIPPPVRYSSREDGLWRTTCFEAFVRAEGGEAYAEFNFSPSTAWAAYRFTAYRSGGDPIDLPAPHFDVEFPGGAMEVSVVVDASALPAMPLDVAWHLNATAVIEEKDGRKSYWALAHQPGPPDFHHPDCFVLDLPPPASS